MAAPHLVSAACHRDPGIASLAVDCLRHLVGQLLSRAELSNFTYQVGPGSEHHPRMHITLLCPSRSPGTPKKGVAQEMTGVLSRFGARISPPPTQLRPVSCSAFAILIASFAMRIDRP